MPVPYTRDAVKALRHAAATNISAAEIQQLFGWDAAKLTRVCRTHEIDIVDIRGCASLAASECVAPPLDSSPCIASPLDAILARLTERQAQIFRALQPHADGRWFTTAWIANRIGVDSRISGIRDSVKGLGRKLERMEAQYQIEDKSGPWGGFRLVTDKAST